MKRNLTIPLATGLMMFPQIAETIYSPALPQIAQSFAVSPEHAGQTLSFYFLAFAIGVVVWGRLCDKLGRRPTMLIGLFLYMVASLIALISPNFEMLMLARMLAAFGAAVGSVGTQTMMRDMFDGKKLAQVFSIMGIALAVSPAIGMMAGSLLTSHFGYQGMFAGLAALAVLLLLWSAIQGLMKLQWDPGADHQVKLTAEWFERRTDIDQKYDSSASKYQNESYDRSLKMQRSRFALEHRWSTPAEWLDEVKWSLSYSPQKRDTFGDQIRNYNTQTPAKRERYETIRNYSEKFLQGDVQLTSSFDLGQSHHKLIYGFAGDYTKTDYDGTNITTSLNDGSVKTQHGKGFSFPRVDTVRADIYLQDEIKLLNDRLTITPGLRLATYSIDPTKDDEHVPVTGFSPEKINKTRLIKRLGATYKLDDNYSVFGSYGEAFKMPTSSQLFSATESTFFKIIPNPNLKPESVQSYEAGIRGEFDRGYFSLSGFYSDYDDFIQVWQLVPGTANTLTSYNYSSVKVWGIELGGEYEIYNNLYAHGSLSYMRGDQRSTPDADRTPFDGATPLTTVLGLRYFMPDWNLETEFVGTFAKGPSRRANPNAYKPSGYAVFDAYARWKPTKSIDINFGVENIFDKRYFPNTLTNYANTAPSNVANANPLELQTAAGRTFKLGATMRF